MSRPASRSEGVPGFRPRFGKKKAAPPCKICGGKVPFNSEGGHADLCLACARDEQRTVQTYYEWTKYPRHEQDEQDDTTN